MAAQDMSKSANGVQNADQSAEAPKRRGISKLFNRSNRNKQSASSPSTANQSAQPSAKPSARPSGYATPITSAPKPPTVEPRLRIVTIPSPPDPSTDPVGYLRSIHAVRQCSKTVFERAKSNTLRNFDVDWTQAAKVTNTLKITIKREFEEPGYNTIPPHGRYQHINAGGEKRVEALTKQDAAHGIDDKEITRRILDLFVVSVLLDAGAGDQWKYKSGSTIYTRSEGLAVASYNMFVEGMFSSAPQDAPNSELWRVDPAGLRSLSVQTVATCFQVTEGNPMSGVAGRTTLLHGLANALEANPDFFGSDLPRPGNMLDYLLAHPTTATDRKYKIVALPVLWDVLIRGLELVWPRGRPQLNGQTVGDAWPLQYPTTSTSTNANGTANGTANGPSNNTAIPTDPSNSTAIAWASYQSGQGLELPRTTKPLTKRVDPRRGVIPASAPSTPANTIPPSDPSVANLPAALQGIMPFHKLTQWLCYSLLVPLKRFANVYFAGEDLLTGLPEYRNGGLFLDTGLLSLKEGPARTGILRAAALASQTGKDLLEPVPTFDVSDAVVVEWRALTVALLDYFHGEVKRELGVEITLAQMLEAGSWKAGRELAAIVRPNGRGGPLAIESDGTVF